ncbi:MAG: hypothetical protein AABW67_03650, partial [Nanoarchaeota archaeon]
MKNKAILVSFVAFLAIIFALNTVLAAFASVDDIIVNDISIKTGTAAGEVSRTIPVEVMFTANQDAEDVRVKVYIEGYKSEISETTERFHIVNGSKYIKRFSIELPSSMDMDNLTEDLFLNVRISAKTDSSFFADRYPITMQKDLYSLNILSVET